MWKLTINADANIEWICDFLTEHQALAVSLQDAGEQPLFQEALNETPLWKDTQIQGLFAEYEQALIVIKSLQIALSQALVYEIDGVIDQDWVQKTQNQFPPQCFAKRLWIVPAWQDPHAFSGIVLRLEPGLGFGTGAHPTTALCLDWLAQQPLNAKVVIDYGCGSGILGLAALALGAKTVWAVDHDPQALTATINNAQLNEFSATLVRPVLPEQLPEIKADIIVANILANPLCELAPRIMQHLAEGGILVLSGFLSTETDRVAKAYQPALQPLTLDVQDDWVRLVLKKVD